LSKEFVGISPSGGNGSPTSVAGQGHGHGTACDVSDELSSVVGGIGGNSRESIGVKETSCVGVSSFEELRSGFMKGEIDANGNNKGHDLPAVKRGPNWERNQEWKKNNKAKKGRKQNRMRQNWRQHSGVSESSVSSSVLSGASAHVASEVVSEVLSEEVHISLQKKWKVENELATERARRQLEVLKANDVDQEVKRYRTKVSAATEKNMVSIEKTHAMLQATGNVPGAFHGSAETVVSGEPGLTDGSISPNSSASMAEFRACQKNLLDSQSEIADLKRKMQLMSERFGFPMQHADYIDKRTWTDNEENDAILGDMYPDGYGMNTMFMPEGKFRPC